MRGRRVPTRRTAHVSPTLLGFPERASSPENNRPKTDGESEHYRYHDPSILRAHSKSPAVSTSTLRSGGIT